MRGLRKKAKALTIFAALAAAAVTTGRQASALTAQEVTGKMSQDQRFGYLSGLIDMSIYQAAASGNKARAQCIHDAFYPAAAAANDPWRSLNDALREFSDKRPESIVTLIIQKMCGA